MLDEPLPATSGQYSRPHTRAWSEAIASFDGYVFVTPEYNHGRPAHSRTPSISYTTSGTTRRRASSATGSRWRLEFREEIQL
jgi:hypothetical protein